MATHRDPRPEDPVTLKLSEWELANLHLPPVTTVTYYSGTASIDFLRHRVASILDKNPWLTARIVKKSTPDGVIALAYRQRRETAMLVDQHLSVFRPGEIGLSARMDYEAMVRCLSPIQCARSRPATDTDEPLFKVAVVPLEGGDAGNDVSFLHSVSVPGFALLVSMNHSVGDGHTYYKLYGMLDAKAEVKALDPIRVSGFEEAKKQVIGERESALLSSAGIGLGIMGTYFLTKLTRREPQHISVHRIDPAWIAAEKTNAKELASVPFVSTNDALTSWFFREMKSDTNIMVANFRGRQPAISNLSDDHAGNYEANVPYFPGDVETPALIRQSILRSDGGFRAQRAGLPVTQVPGFWTLLRNRAAIITNWASFYHDVTLPPDPSGDDAVLRPQLHLPIMEPDGLITSVWNNGIVFCPRAGELGMLMITRHFDSDALVERKRREGSEMPMSARLV